MGSLGVHQLGLVEYEDGLKLQKLFGEARSRELAPDSLLLLEHPPVLTLGRGGKVQNIIAGEEAVKSLGVEVFHTDRGGDVTYHGPGQIVGYPIFRLPPDRRDVRRYVRDLEESIIRALATFGIRGERIAKWPGVWVTGPRSAAPEKIAALGVHISRWQTSHGFALNVNTDLSHFQLIVPCGISEGGVTSMEQQLLRRVDMAQVQAALAASFGEVFGAEWETRSPSMRTVSGVVLRNGEPGKRVLLLHRVPGRGGFWQTVTGRIEDGESPAQAAERELYEETGSHLAVQELGYRHCFALADKVPPVVVDETAFAARWEGGDRVRLDPSEHDEYAWVNVEEALARLPFRGLRRAVSLASALP
jgi:lipoyl(octanoyl) transferase